MFRGHVEKRGLSMVINLSSHLISLYICYLLKVVWGNVYKDSINFNEGKFDLCMRINITLIYKAIELVWMLLVL